MVKPLGVTAIVMWLNAVWTKGIRIAVSVMYSHAKTYAACLTVMTNITTNRREHG